MEWAQGREIFPVFFSCAGRGADTYDIGTVEEVVNKALGIQALPSELALRCRYGPQEKCRAAFMRVHPGCLAISLDPVRMCETLF